VLAPAGADSGLAGAVAQAQGAMLTRQEGPPRGQGWLALLWLQAPDEQRLLPPRTHARLACPLKPAFSSPPGLVCRYLVEAPPNVCTPAHLADAAAHIAASAPGCFTLEVRPGGRA